MTAQIEHSGADALVLEGVEISLDKRLLIEVDAVVEPGTVLTIMGPSGSGKSSLLAYIAGFLDPAFKAGGTVRLGSTNITNMSADARRVGMLFQDPLLFPHMSVGQNLLFAIPPDTKLREERNRLARQALQDAELEGFFERDPATLSGGQKARVALIRVLLSRPRALLLDEPFSKLDADLRSQVRRFVFEQAHRLNLPVLLVTHDQEDAATANGAIITL